LKATLLDECCSFLVLLPFQKQDVEKELDETLMLTD
jgi:hypothetical protein